MTERRSNFSAPARMALEKTAAEWLARRDAGWSPADETAHRAWLAADRRHAEAWETVESSWLAFDDARRGGMAERMIAELAARRHRRRWRRVVGTGAMLAAAACVTGLFVTGPAGRTVSHDPPVLGILSRPERRVLPDGSTVELNGGAQVEVSYSATRRDVRLVRGEAHFTVEKDPLRPFLVAVSAVEVRAVGTAFAIKLDARAVEVLVTQGQVTVDEAKTSAAAATASGALFVDAGACVTVPVARSAGETLQATRVSKAEIAHRLGWRGPRLELSATPLEHAVAALNRENGLQIAVADRALRKMRLSGVFRADNPEGFLRLLESHYGVSVERRGGGEIILRAAR